MHTEFEGLRPEEGLIEGCEVLKYGNGSSDHNVTTVDSDSAFTVNPTIVPDRRHDPDDGLRRNRRKRKVNSA